MRTVIALVALCATAFAQETTDKVTLEWKLKKGETLVYEMNQTQTMDFAGTPFTQEIGFTLSQNVEEVTEEGLATLKVQYTRVRHKMSGPMESEYDSETDKEPEAGNLFATLFSVLIGKPFTMTLDRQGKIHDVKGLQEILEEAFESMDEDAGGGAMREQFSKQYSDENMKKMLQQSFAFLPGKPVGPGDTWEGEGEYPAGAAGKISMKMLNTFKETKASGAEAVYGTDITMEMDLGEDAPGAGMVQLDDAKGSLQTVWDLEGGALKSNEGTLTMTMKMGEQGMEMEAKQSMKLVSRETEGKKKDY